VEKDKALEMAVLQIERQYGKGSIMRLGDESAALRVPAISTGSLGLDIALGVGGVPRGRVVEIFGPESSGKTTLALHSSPKPSGPGVRPRSSMPSMPWIPPIPVASGSTSTSCWSLNPTTGSKPWR
jgi:hypothetical protein